MAAVATRERCGRVETAGGSLGGDWPETVCVLMSSVCLSVCVGASAHTLTPSSINTVSGRSFRRSRVRVRAGRYVASSLPRSLIGAQISPVGPPQVYVEVDYSLGIKTTAATVRLFRLSQQQRSLSEPSVINNISTNTVCWFLPSGYVPRPNPIIQRLSLSAATFS